MRTQRLQTTNEYLSRIQILKAIHGRGNGIGVAAAHEEE